MPGYSSTHRLLAFAVLLAALLLHSGCGSITPSGFSGNVDLLLGRGEAYVNGLSHQPAERLTDPEIIALGYLERARLGLGSPFRLIDYVLRDPDLPESVRSPLAYGLLARTVQGRTYYVDPDVLEVARLAGVPAGRGAGLHQLRLAERAVSVAPTAAAGERTVRLGYLLAASERTVEPGYTLVVAHVAALLADRRRAQEDATLLLRSAARQQRDPLALLQEWRRDLRLRVEQPSLGAFSVREEEFEAKEGPPLALALRTLAQRHISQGSLLTEVAQPDVRDQASLLGEVAANRLLELSRERNYPAQAPVAVAVAINREGLITRSGLQPWQLEARAEFADGAWNEELLAGGAAHLRALGAHEGQRLSLILLQSATFLRVWNQEEVWFPGDAAPSARDLEGRFGLASLRFDEAVPESWRPYYLRMLGRSLAEMQRVLPTASARGLNIRIGELPGDTRALALHEPRTRTLYLPPHTGAGTIAHELGHDLDWQLARRRYGARSGYATDKAVRDNRGDRIAVAMMELSASLVQPNLDGPVTAHATRPAEVFARGTDWLVAAVLARDGRLGGYLTSFQDPVLTGYGTTRGPDITGAAVPALLSILDGIAPAAEPTRDWALDTYGPSRTLTVMELARAIAEAGHGLALDRRLQEIELVTTRSLEAVTDCRFGSVDGMRRLVTAQSGLAQASRGAAARGAAIDAVRALASDQASIEARPAVEAWLAWRLYGGPEPVDPVLEQLAPAFEDLLLLATMIERDGRAPTARSAFHLGAAPALCGGNPFAADTPVGRFRMSLKGGAN